MKKSILKTSRQDNLYPLDEWFSKRLDKLIENHFFYLPRDIQIHTRKISDMLTQYSINNNIKNVVIGISGGIDSALTASLFQYAGWNVKGVLMPIYQDEEETERGIEVCEELDIQYENVNLTRIYDVSSKQLNESLILEQSHDLKVRNGNLRARIRMMYLYNLASGLNGLVGSTDNFSELTAGFWTLHGDVGDIAPLQSFYKSWEVPQSAKYLGVPESVIKATPTDGLGITTGGDESQLGVSYLEWDIVLMSLLNGMELDHSNEKVKRVINRIKKTRFKRIGPIYAKNNPTSIRFSQIEELDERI